MARSEKCYRCLDRSCRLSDLPRIDVGPDFECSKYLGAACPSLELIRPPWLIRNSAWVAGLFLGLLIAAYCIIWVPAQRRESISVAIGRIEHWIEKDELDAADAEAKKFLEISWVSAANQQTFRQLWQKSRQRRQSWRGTLEIREPQPSWAMILLNGSVAQVQAVALPVGMKHEVQFSAPGYASSSKSVVFNSNGEKSVVDGVALDRFTGSVRLQSQPPGIELEMRIHQSESGRPEEFAPVTTTSPAELTDVPTGEYEVRWKRDGIVEEQSRVTVRSGEIATSEVDLRLAQVSITSDPPKAMLFEDERYLGSLGGDPLPLQLKPGPHRLEARYKNWPVKVTEIIADADKPMPVAFKWDYAAVSFDSFPPGARIFLGAEEVDVTPSRLPVNVRSGVVTFRATYPDLDDVFLDVAVNSGTTPQAMFQFDVGQIVIESVPSGAVIVGPSGRPIRMPDQEGRLFDLTTPVTLFRRPGSLRLRLEKPGYQPVAVTESVRAQKTLKLSVSLERER